MKHVTLRTRHGLVCDLIYNPVLGWLVRLNDVAMNADHAQVFRNDKTLIVGSLTVSLADDEQVKKASDFIDEMEKQINMFFDEVDSRGGVL